MDTPPQGKQDRRALRRRVGGGALSLAVHVALLLGLFLKPSAPLPPAASEPMIVSLVDFTQPEKAPGPDAASAASAAPAPPKPAKPRPPQIRARPTPNPPVDVEPLPASEAPALEPGADEVSDSELASAANAGAGAGSGSGAGGGGGGGQCDMAAYLQAELRKDEQVREAFARAHASTPARKAVRVWNGDWVRSHGQEGAGLAVVREAILMEVAFAPSACRKQAMRGLVLISLNDGPGGLRLALGAGAWRWSDLLGPRGSTLRE